MWGKEGSGLRAMLISSEITLRVRFGLAWGVSTRFNLPPKPSSRSLWSAWVTTLFGRFGRWQLSSVTQMKLWKCLTPLSWQNQFHVSGLHSCQWSALGGPQSNNHLLFAQSSQPWLQSLVTYLLCEKVFKHLCEKVKGDVHLFQWKLSAMDKYLECGRANQRKAYSLTPI